MFVNLAQSIIFTCIAIYVVCETKDYLDDRARRQKYQER